MAKTKKEFYSKLEERLIDVPESERQKLLEYYNELYLDKLESGLTEVQIIESFGDPVDAAEKFLNDMPLEKENPAQKKPDAAEQLNAAVQTEKGGQSDENGQSLAEELIEKGRGQVREAAKKAKPLFKNKTFWTIYLAGFVITFPLTIAAFGVVIGILGGLLGALIGLVAAVFSVCISMAACLAAGIYGVISSVIVMFESVPVGLVQLAAGLCATGVGLLGIYVTIKLFKLTSKLFKKGGASHGTN